MFGQIDIHYLSRLVCAINDVNMKPYKVHAEINYYSPSLHTIYLSQFQSEHNEKT